MSLAKKEEERDKVESREAKKNVTSSVVLERDNLAKIEKDFANSFQREGADFATDKEFVQQGREVLRRILEKEKKQGAGKERKDDSLNIYKRSPYLQIDREIMEKQEIYNSRIDNVFSKLTEERFRDLAEFRFQYVKAKEKIVEKTAEKEKKENFHSTLQMQISNCNREFEEKSQKLENLITEILQHEKNIEVIIRIKQGQVEISLIEIAPNLEHAVLLKKKVILDYNVSIRNKRIFSMENSRKSQLLKKQESKTNGNFKFLIRKLSTWKFAQRPLNKKELEGIQFLRKGTNSHNLKVQKSRP